MLSVLAFAAVSCIEEKFENDMPLAESGDEVQFGVSLGNPETRTVYGDESNNAFPIYWVDGDKVQIFSPQCLSGRRNAEYKVELPANVDNPNYADDLTPTGEYGVQWGDVDYATFYSLYPSGNYTLSSKGDLAENITISPTQNIIVDGSSVKSDMEDCLMYAKNDGGEENEYKGVQKGQVVNLHYNPISTVFMVTLNVPSTSADDFTIQSISLTAPNNADGTAVNIAGTFSLKIDDGSFAEWGASASNTVSALLVDKNTGGYYTLKKDNSVTVPLFIAPVTGLNTNGWKIKVVANAKEYVKTLGSQDLVAGKIHKVTLPNLSTAAATEWDVSKWMTYIPRNVYLSEVSIPGTWNSLNVDCQSETNIAEQYKLGVRAFHLDTRWRADNSPWVGETFTGITKPTITTLSVATGGSGNTHKYDGGNLMKPSFKSFAEYLGQITGEVQEDEYMVVFCTFAQNNYNGDLCPSTWFEAVSNACAANDKVYDASNITANTLVGDVLNKVIVIVNLDSSVSSTTLPANSKCLFTYIPMQLPEDYYAEATSHTDALYYSTKTAAGISMYTSHAQISTTGTSPVDCGDRGYSHPLTNRDALVTSFWDWSKNNYGTTNYSHDKWIYLGLGGYIMTSSSSGGSGYDTIENRYAPMIYNRIDEMGSNNIPFYPVGIILMNNKHGKNYTSSEGTDLKYNFGDVCKKVLMLNNKYRLQYDSSKPSDYSPQALSLAEYGSTAKTGGDAF